MHFMNFTHNKSIIEIHNEIEILVAKFIFFLVECLVGDRKYEK